MPNHVIHVKLCHDIGGFRQLNFNDVGRGGRGGEGRVKKCFLGLRQTALLSAEGKNPKNVMC
jgi:hypothetical protein